MALLELYRGDEKSYPAKVSTSIWATGGKLFFAAKSAIDNDGTDNSAVIKKTMTDDDITAVSADYVTYTVVFTSTDTNVEPGSYVGEFQYVDALGRPTTYRQFTVRVDGDINRRTS